jgi:hypothetical protein
MISRVVQGSGSTAPWFSDTSLLSMNGYYINWTVPETRQYRITAEGASGGSNSYYTGGVGATIVKDITLEQGAVLKIIVGQIGVQLYQNNNSGGGGGGGGTYVAYADDTPLVIAGGGGGASHASNGENGALNTDGTASGAHWTSQTAGSCSSGQGAWTGGGGGGFNNCQGSGWTSGGFFYTSGDGFLAGGVGGDGESGYSSNDKELGGFGGGGGASDEGGGGGGWRGGGSGSTSYGAGGGGSYAINGWDSASAGGGRSSGRLIIAGL